MSYEECKTANCRKKRYEGSAGKLAYCRECLKKKGVIADGEPKPDPEADEIWPASYAVAANLPKRA